MSVRLRRLTKLLDTTLIACFPSGTLKNQSDPVTGLPKVVKGTGDVVSSSVRLCKSSAKLFFARSTTTTRFPTSGVSA